MRPFLEQVAAFSHTVEQVEACAAGTQQHGVARMGKGAAGKDAAADAVSVADGQSAVLEHSLQLAIVCSEEHEGLAFFFHQIHNGGVVVALVLAAENQDNGRGNGFEGHAAGIYVGGFGIVDE